MNTAGNLIRRALYRILPLEVYLWLLSQGYFVAFSLGLLKSDRNYHYPYFLKEIIKEGDVCIDIGANLGYVTVLLSKLTGEQGKVYAVEPVKPVLSVLRRNTRSMENVEILPFALGADNRLIKVGNNSIGKMGFMASGRNFVLDNEESATIEFDTQMRKGSEVFQALERLDFIKCDVEGYEGTVLTELEPVISKFRPVLLVESRGELRKKIIEFFEQHNYHSLVLQDDRLLQAQPDGKWDMLIVPDEKQDMIAKYDF